jgi:hypothetical protein
MANRYVRLYNGPEQSNIIGFSMSAIPEQSADLEGYLAEKGYETHRYEWFGEEANPKDEEVIKKLGGVSFMYLGVQPPLKDEHIQEFAGWCRNNVDPYHNSGLLIDNRNTLSPIEPFSYSPSDVVADW